MESKSLSAESCITAPTIKASIMFTVMDYVGSDFHILPVKSLSRNEIKVIAAQEAGNQLKTQKIKIICYIMSLLYL